MLYNIKEGRPQSMVMCLKCEKWNKQQMRCVGGMNKICFAYDHITGTIIDGITKLPIKEINNGNHK